MKYLLATLLLIINILSMNSQVSCDSIHYILDNYAITVKEDSIFDLYGEHVDVLLSQSKMDIECSYLLFDEYLWTARTLDHKTDSLVEVLLEIYNVEEHPLKHMMLLDEKVINVFYRNEIVYANLLLDSIYNIFENNKDSFTKSDDAGKLAMAFSDHHRVAEANVILSHYIKYINPQDSFDMFASRYRMALNANLYANPQTTLDLTLKANEYMPSDIEDFIKMEFYTFQGVIYGQNDMKEKGKYYLDQAKDIMYQPMLLTYILRGLSAYYRGTDSAAIYQNELFQLLEDNEDQFAHNTLREGYIGLRDEYYTAGNVNMHYKATEYLIEHMDSLDFTQRLAKEESIAGRLMLKKLNIEERNTIDTYINTLSERHDTMIMQSTNELKAEFETSLTKKENDALKYQSELDENRIKQQRLYTAIALLGLILLGSLAYLLYRQREKQKSFNNEISNQRDQIQVLNQELNHRVKNNLAFMTSLLQMQGRRQTNVEAQKAIQESETRLKALSLVHEKLFYKEKDTTIDLKDYLESVLSYLEQLFGEAQRPVKLNLISEQQSVAAEDAMRIGLIINELVTNSVKHHNSDKENIEIDIQINGDQSQNLTIDYSDGSYKYDYHQEPDAEQSTSMGKMLIYLLLDQLSPKVRIV